MSSQSSETDDEDEEEDEDEEDEDVDDIFGITKESKVEKEVELTFEPTKEMKNLLSLSTV